jgi:hypothetical protein
MWRSYADTYSRTIRDYDLAGPGLPDHPKQETWRSRIIGSRLTCRQRDDVIRRARQAPWASVPADAELAQADPGTPDGLLVRAARLYWHFTWPQKIPGAGTAKIHKIPHIKRPGLYPILDSRTLRLDAPGASAWPGRLSHLDGITSHDAPCSWAAFREDPLSNHKALRQHRHQLADDQDSQVPPMARPALVRPPGHHRLDPRRARSVTTPLTRTAAPKETRQIRNRRYGAVRRLGALSVCRAGLAVRGSAAVQLSGSASRAMFVLLRDTRRSDVRDLIQSCGLSCGRPRVVLSASAGESGAS